MAKALVISGVDFSTNKLATVALSERVPCTGITLNKQSLSISSIGGTATILSTATPSNTTDSVSWATSNSAVVTVAGGVVTATGVGTATITASCGSKTATCSITVTAQQTIYYVLNNYAAKDTGKDYLTGGALNTYVVGGSQTGEKSAIVGVSSLYPVRIPSGASHISIVANGFKIYGFWVDPDTGCSVQDNVAKAYDKDSVFGTLVQDSKTVDIISNVKGFVLVFRCTASSLTQELVDAITVTFS